MNRVLGRLVSSLLLAGLASAAANACYSGVDSLSPFPCASDGTCPQELECSAAKQCVSRPQCEAAVVDGSSVVETDCKGTCVDLRVDPQNCGSCGRACTGTSTGCCIVNAADPVDPPVWEGACKDLQSDNNNCGTCGRACTGGKTCSAGSCSCPSGQTYCASADSCVTTTAGTCPFGTTWTVSYPGLPACGATWTSQCGSSTFSGIQACSSPPASPFAMTFSGRDVSFTIPQPGYPLEGCMYTGTFSADCSSVSGSCDCDNGAVNSWSATVQK